MRWTDGRRLYLDRAGNMHSKRVLSNEACWVAISFSVGIVVGALIRPFIGGG